MPSRRGFGPPGPDQSYRELQQLHMIAANRTPEGDVWASKVAGDGGTLVVRNMLGSYVRTHSILKGSKATGMVTAANAATLRSSTAAKSMYKRMRPFDSDPTLPVLGDKPRDFSYPSGHTATAHATARVMAHLWPERAEHFIELARQAGQARVYAGVHYPSDVAAGEELGRRVAEKVTGVPQEALEKVATREAGGSALKTGGFAAA